MLQDDRPIGAPQSVLRVLQILETLSASPAALGLAELSRRLDAPKSSIAALLRGLVKAGYVVAVEGGYGLGPAAFGLGSALLESRRRLQTPELVRQGMRRLASASGETVLFAVPDQDGETLTYVEVIDSRNALRFAVAVGDRRPLYCTAAGRVLLAARGDEGVKRYLKRLKPQRLTARTETDKARLASVIATAREAGVAQTDEQASDDVTGTAAAMRDASGEVVGALVVAAPTLRLHTGREELARLVAAEAQAISASLGYRSPSAL